MKTRRGFMLMMVTGLVGTAFVVGSVLADELIGVLTKIDAEGKTITVAPKGGGKDVKVKITGETEQVTKKGTRKVDLEKLEKFLAKVQDNGAEGIPIKVTHEKGVASKLEVSRKKSNN